MHATHGTTVTSRLIGHCLSVILSAGHTDRSVEAVFKIIDAVDFPRHDLIVLRCIFNIEVVMLLARKAIKESMQYLDGDDTE